MEEKVCPHGQEYCYYSFKMANECECCGLQPFWENLIKSNNVYYCLVCLPEKDIN